MPDLYTRRCRRDLHFWYDEAAHGLLVRAVHLLGVGHAEMLLFDGAET